MTIYLDLLILVCLFPFATYSGLLLLTGNEVYQAMKVPNFLLGSLLIIFVAWNMQFIEGSGLV